MDGSAGEITFDEKGVCNFCHQAQAELLATRSILDLNELLLAIKAAGVGKKYDCLIGLSGGIDSSYTLVKAVEFGLRPLCFTVDNGWNDPKADENIMRLVEGLKVPFYRYTIDLQKFKSLQGAFMQAGLINLEIPTDHILMAASLEMARDNDIKYILSGGNVATESIMPFSWSYPARDLVHIKSVYKWATGKRLQGLPVCGLLKWNIYKWWYGIKTAYLLDYLYYNRADSIKLLNASYGWQDYGEKHGESIFTRWFQSFYLFEKFGIDKRKAHFSSLINSGQMTRQEALDALTASPVYPEIGIEQRVMSYPKSEHTEFASDLWRWNLISKIMRHFV